MDNPIGETVDESTTSASSSSTFGSFPLSDFVAAPPVDPPVVTVDATTTSPVDPPVPPASAVVDKIPSDSQPSTSSAAGTMRYCAANRCEFPLQMDTAVDDVLKFLQDKLPAKKQEIVKTAKNLPLVFPTSAAAKEANTYLRFGKYRIYKIYT